MSAVRSTSHHRQPSRRLSPGQNGLDGQVRPERSRDARRSCRVQAGQATRRRFAFQLVLNEAVALLSAELADD